MWRVHSCSDLALTLLCALRTLNHKPCCPMVTEWLKFPRTSIQGISQLLASTRGTKGLRGEEQTPVLYSALLLCFTPLLYSSALPLSFTPPLYPTALFHLTPLLTTSSDMIIKDSSQIIPVIDSTPAHYEGLWLTKVRNHIPLCCRPLGAGLMTNSDMIIALPGLHGLKVAQVSEADRLDQSRLCQVALSAQAGTRLVAGPPCRP